MQRKGQQASKHSRHQNALSELGPYAKLVLSWLTEGQALEVPTSPAFALVVSGTLLDLDHTLSLVEGEGLCLRTGHTYVAQTPAFLYQFRTDSAVSEALENLSARLRRKDPQTAGHSARVGFLAWQLGRALGLEAPRLGRLALAAYLHDIGKLRLPTGLLQSAQPLTVAQWQLMMGHPEAGRELLEDTPLKGLGTVLEQHHERFNGSGYPHGLKGDAISLEAYIIGVADTFDAITHPRPYQTARSVAHALSEINRYSHVLYPAEVVSALNRVHKTKS